MTGPQERSGDNEMGGDSEIDVTGRGDFLIYMVRPEPLTVDACEMRGIFSSASGQGGDENAWI